MWQHGGAYRYYVVSPWAAVSPVVMPMIASLTSEEGVMWVPTLCTSPGGGCEPLALMGFGAVLVPKRSNVAGEVVVSSWVSSRDVREPSKPDVARILSTMRGLGRIR